MLQLADVETPTPGPNEILVKVHAAALNPVDWHFVRGVPFPIRMATGGLRRPKRHRRVGGDYSGTIAAFGSSVTGFTVGEPVFGLGDGSLCRVSDRAGRSRIVRQAGAGDVRAGGGRPARRPHGAAGAARQGAGPIRSPRPDCRRRGRHRHLRGAAREGIRCRRHGRAEHGVRSISCARSAPIA